MTEQGGYDEVSARPTAQTAGKQEPLRSKYRPTAGRLGRKVLQASLEELHSQLSQRSEQH